MPSITLAIDGADVPVVKRLLLKMQASELSDLRRAQTQLAVYGDRRASMDGEPAAIESRLEVLSDLLAQIDATVDGVGTTLSMGQAWAFCRNHFVVDSLTWLKDG